MINNRLNNLRKYMQSEAVDLIIIPTSDFHDSEYVSDYFKLREYFSGFSGSAGTLVVSMDEAVLYTDSRYFIQAISELKNSEIKLMKMGTKDVPKLEDYVLSKLDANMTVGFDGRVINAKLGISLKTKLSKKGCHLRYDIDPRCAVDATFSMDFKPQMILEDKYTGEDIKKKLKRVIDAIKNKNADSHIMATLDDIAYITNLRGCDIECNPVFFSYMTFIDDEVTLYANINGDNKEKIIDYLKINSVILKEYDKFYDEGLKSVKNRTKKGILLDLKNINYYIYAYLMENNIIDMMTPSKEFKAVKNNTEIENIKKANVKDGIAVLRFNKFLDDCIANDIELTELDIVNKLYEFRCKEPTMMGPSFETIAAFKEHGAIVHYSVSKESNAKISKGSFLLIDSGSQYLEGTTDITRTYSIGEVPDKLKQDYTLVLRAHLNLMNAQFKSGVRGSQLDMFVEELFWKEGKDFGHGTGHGIGSFLNVHEDPVRISWPIVEDGTPGVIFKPGMLVSDEPGLYIEDEYGIRIENDILCIERFSNEYGTFLGFEAVTLAPIDTKCIYWPHMTNEDIDRLNRYHKKVYDELSVYLEGEELDYLYEVTKEVSLK